MRAGLEDEDPPAVRLCLGEGGSKGLRGGESLKGPDEPAAKQQTRKLLLL